MKGLNQSTVTMLLGAGLVLLLFMNRQAKAAGVSPGDVTTTESLVAGIEPSPPSDTDNHGERVVGNAIVKNGVPMW